MSSTSTTSDCKKVNQSHSMTDDSDSLGTSVIILHQINKQSLKHAIKTCINNGIITHVVICSSFLYDHIKMDTIDSAFVDGNETMMLLKELCNTKGKKNVTIVNTLNYESQIPTQLFIKMTANTYLSSQDIHRMIRDAREDHFSRGSYKLKIKFNYATKAIKDFLVVYLLMFEWFRSISFFSNNKQHIFDDNTKYYGNGFEDVTTRVFIYKKLSKERNMYTWSTTPKVIFDSSLSDSSKVYYGLWQGNNNNVDNGWNLFKRLYQKMNLSLFTWFLALPCFMLFSASLVKFVTNPEQWFLALCIYIITGIKVNSLVKSIFSKTSSSFSFFTNKKEPLPKLQVFGGQERIKNINDHGIGKNINERNTKRKNNGTINFWFMIILHPLLAIIFAIVFLCYSVVDYIINDN